MLRCFRVRMAQAIETIRFSSFKKLLSSIVYMNREAVPVVMDLSSLRPLDDFPLQSHQLIELSPECISQRALTYPMESRCLKAKKYLTDGYRGFAMVNGDAVSGDIWYSASRSRKSGLLHLDESWLSIRCEQSQVYLFDMYVNPGERGQNLAAALQNGALHELRKRGFTKAYGFFWADNIAALWVHRTLRWRELKRVKASRLVLSRNFVWR